MRRITAFDFDGTLIKGDSLLLFICHARGLWRMLWGMLLHLPWLIGMKCGICEAGKVKERLFAHFFGGMGEAEFLGLCHSFAPVLTQLENREVSDLLKARLAENEEVCIVSASVPEWIEPWGRLYGNCSIIGTEIEVADGRLTGRFATPNCNGTEKPRRLLTRYPDRSNYRLEVYGDSAGDQALMEMADEATMVPPHHHRLSSFIYCDLFLIFLAASLPLMPTMDDWVYLTAPKIGANLVDLLMPAHTYWRPFDGLIGYFGGLWPALFPYFNHALIAAGHVLSASVLYRICRHSLCRTERESLIAMLFFLFSPGMLGTVLDIDSANQVYSLLFGLLATRLYLRTTINSQLSTLNCQLSTINCQLLLLIGTLWKENAAAFIAVMPLLAWGTRRITLPTAIKHALLLSLWLLPYFALRFIILPQDQVDFNPAYTEGGLMQWARNAGMFLTFTWLPFDFVSILHAPSRNWALALLTIGLSLPMLGLLLRRIVKFADRHLLVALLGSMLAIAAIHLATIFTVMHTYSSLSMAAILVGVALGECNIKKSKYLRAVLAGWLAATLITDAHHTLAAYESGEMGQRMAKSTIAQMKAPVESAYCICLDTGYPKYSMFCTIPADAFGWGEAVRYRTGYEWPKLLDYTTLPAGDTEATRNAVVEAIAGGFDCVWMVKDDKVEVIWQK